LPELAADSLTANRSGWRAVIGGSAVAELGMFDVVTPVVDARRS
jgi:hypothetical protein